MYKEGGWNMKYLLFDLDGTVTDPKVGITTCVQQALRWFAIEEPDLNQLESFIGPPLLDSFMEFYHLSEEQAKKAIEIYRKRFSEVGLYENEIYPGMKELLATLKAEGKILAVASSKPTVFVKKILKYFEIDCYFDVVKGSNLDGTNTKKEEVIQSVLDSFDLHSCDEVMMIGDRKFDVMGAHKLGMKVVAVSYGYGSVEELQEAGADVIVSTVKELQMTLCNGK